MSETNFTKLFSSITASTIWCESPETKVVWITMLAMADAAGFVYASVPGLANIAQVSLDDTEKALDKFLNSDPYSRNSENDGCRIESIDGGWAILNHPKYRKIRDKEERKAYHREYMRKKRAEKEGFVKSGVNNVKVCEPQLTQEEAEAEADKEIPAVAGMSKPSSVSPCPYQKIVDLYHEILPTLPRVVKLTDKRKSHIRSRWKGDADNLKFWEDYFNHVGRSKFLTGQAHPTNGRKVFMADIDFLIREDVIVKTQEGKYNNG
ncbi:MAG: hypothetical protein GY763_00305 [Gammaproteobacteria bacterium]|nr:hypothetical protein [Gammaproteobacteria bacterium]